MTKGFGHLSEEERKAAASRGGRAPKRKPAGFAAMTPERRRELGSIGGKKSAETRRGARIESNEGAKIHTAEKVSPDVSDRRAVRNVDRRRS